MRKFVAILMVNIMQIAKILAIIILSFYPISGHAAIARVAGQAKAVSSGSITTGTAAPITLTSAPATGDLVVVGFFGQIVNFTSVSVVDSNGNTYTPTTSTPTHDTGSGHTNGVFYLQSAPSNASATINVTVNWTGGASDTFYIFANEYSGAATSGAFDVDNAVIGINSSFTLASVTPSVNGEVLFEVVSTGSSLSGVPSPFTIVGTVQAFSTVAGDDIQTTATTQTTNATGTALDTSLIIAAFKPAGGGGSTCPKTLALTGVGC